MKRSILAISMILSASLGILFQIFFGEVGGLTGWNIFKAFTVQSNIWIAVMTSVIVLWQYSHPQQQLPKWMIVLKFMTTTSILLTYIVFAVLLSPLMEMDYLLSPTNLFLHVVTPMLAIIDFIMFDSLIITKRTMVYSALVLPLIYATIFEIVYAMTNQLPVPYFFLDYQEFGWFSLSYNHLGIAYWIALIASMLALIANGLFALSAKLLLPRHRIKALNVVVAGMTVVTIISIVIQI